MSDTEVHNWRVVVTPLEPGEDARPRWKQILKPRRVRWRREVSYSPDRWFIDAEGYAETFQGAVRKAVQLTYSVYVLKAERLEVEYAIRHPKRSYGRDLRPAPAALELLTTASTRTGRHDA